MFTFSYCVYSLAFALLNIDILEPLRVAGADANNWSISSPCPQYTDYIAVFCRWDCL
jgi:hypothetical protein